MKLNFLFMANYKETIRVLVVSNEELLFLQKNKDSNIPLHWEFPGGKVDEDDTFIQTAIKELEEETGIKCNSSEIIDLGIEKFLRFPHRGGIAERRVQYLLVNFSEKPEVRINQTTDDQGMSEDKHSDYKWVKLSDLHNYEYSDKSNFKISPNSLIDFSTLEN